MRAEGLLIMACVMMRVTMDEDVCCWSMMILEYFDDVGSPPFFVLVLLCGWLEFPPSKGSQFFPCHLYMCPTLFFSGLPVLFLCRVT